MAFRPSVKSLFRRSRPATIPWFVISVVVDSIDLHACRSLAHVSKKIFEGHPAFAYRNTASAIIGKLFEFWIRASVSHSLPNIVRLCFSIPSRLTVSESVGVSNSPAAATGSLGWFGDDFFYSAIASNKPKRTSIHVRKADDNKSSKSNPGDILESRHDGSSRERLRLETARRFRGEPFRIVARAGT